MRQVLGLQPRKGTDFAMSIGKDRKPSRRGA